MLLNRISGALIAAFGAALLLLVIPHQVEVVDYGWVRPETVPNVIAVGLVLLGLAQVVVAKGKTELQPGPAVKAFAYLGFTALAIWAMGRFGFVVIAPAMMLVLMLWIGERRPLWLGIGTLVVPGVIWGTVTVLLDRTLPG